MYKCKLITLHAETDTNGRDQNSLHVK